MTQPTRRIATEITGRWYESWFHALFTRPVVVSGDLESTCSWGHDHADIIAGAPIRIGFTYSRFGDKKVRALSEPQRPQPNLSLIKGQTGVTNQSQMAMTLEY